MSLMPVLPDRLLGWPADLPEEVQRGLVDSYHENMSLFVVLFANSLVAAALVVTGIEVVPLTQLALWWGAVFAVALYNTGWQLHYRADPQRHDAHGWAVRFLTGGPLNGMVWGIGALLLFNPDHLHVALMGMVVLCGMSAGQVVASAALPGGSAGFLLPAIGIATAGAVFEGGTIGVVLGFLGLIYGGVLLALSRYAFRSTVRSLQLGYENRRLAERLSRAKESAERMGHAKTQFLAVMSHEIRTPMNGILGLTELLSDAPLEPRYREYLKLLQSTGGHLADMLNNILDLSRLDAGQVALERRPFNLSGVVRDSVGMFSTEADHKGVELRLEMSALQPVFRLGDARALRQILVNLVGNAIKFTERGRVDIVVRGAGEGRVRFEVSDTGPGIPSDHQRNIFDPFVQVDSSATRHHEGSGLGLSIARQLVEGLGGELELQSPTGPAGGTRFSFTVVLPLAEMRSQAPVERCGSLPPMRLLLVDDSELNRLVFSEYFAGSGCRLDSVGDGAAALELFRTRRYDVVLLDIRMPGIDGCEVARRMRALEATRGQPRTAVLALSAGAFDNDRVDALEAGCDDYLAKPISRQELIAAVVNRVGDHERELESELAEQGIEPALQHLLPKLTERLDNELTELERALQRDDLTTAARIIHTAKGECGLFGVAELADTFAVMEQRITSGGPAVASYLEAIRQGLDRLRVKNTPDSGEQGRKRGYGG